MSEERHLTSAEKTDPAWIRGILAGLPVATAIATPAGMVAITRAAVIDAGLDPLAVARWLQARGGYGAMTYLRPASHRLANQPCKPPLQPVPYFAVPLHALRPDAAETASAEAAAG